MIKATLQYTDLMQDTCKVYSILAENKILIIKTKPGWGCCPKIIALFKDYNELWDVVYQLNIGTTYGVTLVKYKYIREKRHETE